MTTISNNDIARAIYLVSKNKNRAELREVNEKVLEFLRRKQLLSKANGILEKLDGIINREEGRVAVKVSSAEKKGHKKELISYLKKRYRAKEILLTEILDEKLLGGIKIEANDEIIDLTAKNKLKELQEYLTRKI